MTMEFDFSFFRFLNWASLCKHSGVDCWWSYSLSKIFMLQLSTCIVSYAAPAYVFLRSEIAVPQKLIFLGS
uniref:Uncharacterized protein n=1 Tax=Arundo donax TaxID=35708 RepID=A0A0A9HHI0_ARUDO